MFDPVKWWRKRGSARRQEVPEPIVKRGKRSKEEEARDLAKYRAKRRREKAARESRRRNRVR